MVTAADARFMERALFLAERGRGTTSPNPVVGAVVVSDDGVVVGQGAHLRAGGPHAEVVALEMAGSRARGATLYCTLEPCSHTGRTGPCVERIVPAGIRRVVAAMGDPNPRVSGAGFARLRAEGVEVDVGVGEVEARRRNAAFVTWITKGRPLVTLKTAVSADGFVGRANERVQLTSDEADRYFQRQRAAIDAIAVGAGTMLADDPLLSARTVWRERPLVRVVFDWRLRVPPTARLFSTLQSGPVIMAVGQSAAEAHPERVEALARAGAEIRPFPGRNLAAVLESLASSGVTSLLVEGGPALQQAFVEQGLMDRVQVVRAPVVLGHGVPAAPAIARLEPAGGSRVNVTELGRDRLTEWDVRDVHGSD